MLDNGSHVPFYEYRRPDGTVLEVMQKMTDPPLTEDPETGVPLQRIFHPIAVHFKGKGFYNTDYGTKKRARENAETKASEKKTDDAKKTDATPAATESTAVKKLETAKTESASTKKSSSSSSTSKKT
jgi:predicted nucleic acid-binding Zn ribbon protein